MTLDERPGPVGEATRTRLLILVRRAPGITVPRAAHELGLSKSGVAYHARILKCRGHLRIHATPHGGALTLSAGSLAGSLHPPTSTAAEASA